MKVRFTLSLVLALVAAFVVVQVGQPTALGSAVHVQGGPQKSGQNARPEFKQKLSDAGAKLKRAEAVVDKISAGKQFDKKDIDDYHADMENYGQQVYDAYNESTARAKEYDDTKGAKGGTEDFLHFEDAMKEQVPAAKRLADKFNQVAEEARNGRVKPTKAAIAAMTPQEKAEYRSGLTPQGLKEVEKTHPEIKGQLPNPVSQTVTSAMCGVQSASQRTSDWWARTDIKAAFSNMFMPRVEASAAITCYTLCTSPAAGVCWPCIAKAGVNVINAYTTWRSCYYSCSCAWYRPWCCAKKAGCTAIFIAIVA